MGSEMTGETSALDTLQFQAQQTTNAAAAEGQANVESAKAAGAGYLGQASIMASDVLASAQVISPEFLLAIISDGSTIVLSTGASTDWFRQPGDRYRLAASVRRSYCSLHRQGVHLNSTNCCPTARRECPEYPPASY
jgi:hypothetical protein